VRLLVVLHTPRVAESSVYVGYERLGEYLSGQGHVVSIRTPEDFPSVGRWHARWLPLVYPWAVWWWLRQHGSRFDLVVFHSYAGWVASFWPRRPFRMVTAFHGLEPLFYRELAAEMRRLGRPLRAPFRLVHGWFVPRVLKASCRRSEAVFCLNRAEAQYLETHGWTEAARIVVLPHGLAPEFFLARTHRPAARTLLFVGQWLPTKGTRDLVGAFARLGAMYPALRLCCAGTLAETERVIADFPEAVRSRVEVYPRVTPAQLIDLYGRADVFVFPTLSEGFSLALLEAMAAGLAIVTTPAGAAADLLVPGEDALIVPKRDPDALVAAVARLVDHDDLRARLGQAAQARAREFELERVHARRRAALERVVACSRPRA
jgi:glycosyltransferase involved in cell wall biosynthesis